jgi:hypothetical protein
MVNEELNLVQLVASRLENAGIQYMVTGSMALALYSMPRMTRDIDIIIQVSPAEIGKLVALFQDGFYIDEASARQAVISRTMFNIIHDESVIKVDLIIRKDEEYRIEEFSRRHTVTIDDAAISVVMPEDLVLSKLVWAKQSASELQIRDVRHILKTLLKMDFKYLESWAKKLGVDDMLEKAIAHE